MQKDIERLKEQFRKAKTPQELNDIDKQMSALAENPEEFTESMLEAIRDTTKEIEA